MTHRTAFQMEWDCKQAGKGRAAHARLLAHAFRRIDQSPGVQFRSFVLRLGASGVERGRCRDSELTGSDSEVGEDFAVVCQHG